MAAQEWGLGRVRDTYKTEERGITEETLGFGVAAQEWGLERVRDTYKPEGRGNTEETL
jgi:hypothetical protein